MFSMFNLKLMRLRRYRVFLIIAAIFSLLLVRWMRQDDWDNVSEVSYQGFSHSGGVSEDGAKSPKKVDSNSVSKPAVPEKLPVDIESLAHPDGFPQNQKPEQDVAPSQDSPQGSADTPTKTIPSIPKNDIPDRIPLPKQNMEDLYPGIHNQPPGRVEPEIIRPSPPSVHWSKQEERFPVTRLIQLPSGAPKSIPRIQFAFKDETPVEKMTRESRRDQVKAEMQLAWKGYRDNAWGHDELKPVSGDFKDPFGGWAATLVDSLDTLWIMGMEVEFKEAVEAVANIDFTTANRMDIPVFETTIRYLGGLVAAYDVSEAKFPTLLDKAKELAEVLLGIFDTPNRMPILYYHWKPAFASQPHRASVRASVAEIGTLSMEFTRLAQITKDARYYDAVARITDALYEWQERGTGLDGVFPDTIDASGCNRTASMAAALQAAALKDLPPLAGAGSPTGYKAPMLATVREPPKGRGRKGGQGKSIELQMIPDESGLSKASINVVDDNEPKKVMKRDAGGVAGNLPADDFASSSATATLEVAKSEAVDMSQKPRLAAGTMIMDDLECVPQGLEPAHNGLQAFSMGGGQDSTYEYFTKQYLLLGGLEPKYETMYRKTIAAIKTHMLYRPMIPDDRAILFAGKVLVSPGLDEKTHNTFDAEITHLACFIGGMVGMGAKVFPNESELEIAKMLTDGCVWAYESTESGLMPEYAKAIPCESAFDCPWNQTLWEQHLDPAWARRDQMIADYEANKLRLIAQKEAAAIAEEQALLEEERLMKEMDEEDRLAAMEAKNVEEATTADQSAGAAMSKKIVLADAASTVESTPGQALGANTDDVWQDSNLDTPEVRTDVDSKAPPSTRDGESANEQVSRKHKRQAPRDTSLEAGDPRGSAKLPTLGTTSVTAAPNDGEFNVRTRVSSDTNMPPQPAVVNSQPAVSSQQEKLLQKLKSTEDELSGMPSKQHPTPVKGSLPPDPGFEGAEDPHRPLTHKQYVEQALKREKTPKGYSSIISNQYILRPEAIESVWYMYRITGDKQWAEAGWRMFEAIIAATRTEYGHSAVRPVTAKKPTPNDSMESFWLAETLKYFFLLFSEDSLISLDEWVLNTEAHPFRRPT